MSDATDESTGVGAKEEMDKESFRFPAFVYRGGREPDPRFSLANERTFLAWIRTALALAAAEIGLDLALASTLGRWPYTRAVRGGPGPHDLCDAVGRRRLGALGPG